MAHNCLVFLVVTASLSSLIYVPVHAADHVITVGDEKGWTLGFDYQAWAQNKEFHVGDTLVFNYGEGAHNVIMVNGSAFADCVREPNLAVYASGKDEVVLMSTGNMWFICGVGQHCANGMKFKITVTAEPSVPVASPYPYWNANLAPAPESYYSKKHHAPAGAPYGSEGMEASPSRAPYRSWPW